MAASTAIRSGYAHAVRAALLSELGEELAGLYLYGSAARGAYFEGQSDVDMICVVREPLSAERVRRLLDDVRAVTCPGTVKGLDLWVVPLSSAREPCAEPAFECWLLTSVDLELVRAGDDVGDARLVLLYAMCRDHGLALAGPPPLRVFGPIRRSWLVEAMHVDLALEGAAGWYRVLNACRTLHFIECGTMCGKLEGAAWARPRVADPSLIDAALEWRRHGLGPPLPVARVAAFIDETAARLDGAPPLDAQPTVTPPDLASPVEVTGGEPLVTCVLVCPAEEQLLLLAASRFLEQDWAARELVVLREPGSAAASVLPHDERIRTAVIAAEDIGLWRELALRHGRGDVLAAWDPGTWYAPSRLTQQVRELLSTSAPRVVARSLPAFDPSRDQLVSLRDGELLERTTLCAWRPAWTAGGVANRLGERSDIAILVEPGVGDRGAPAETPDARLVMRAELDRYAAVVPRPAWPPARLPCVSCLMPTYNRRPFAERAIAFFLEQDYLPRELVIVDDGEDEIADLVPAGAPIRYHRLEARASIGAKRELACELADGEILVQWDDDDWHGSGRLRRQVEPLARGSAEMSGILRGYLLDLRTLRFWAGEPPLHEGSVHALLIAGTLAFTRTAWLEAGGYPDRSIGEEVALLSGVKDNGGRVASVTGDGIFIQVRHGANSWRLPFDGDEGPPGWLGVPRPHFLPLADMAFYRALWEEATATAAAA